MALVKKSSLYTPDGDPFYALVPESVTITVNTTGSAGSATGSASSAAIVGYVYGAFFDFHASAPATTDTTLKYGTPGGGNIIVLTNTATDALHHPRKQASDAAGAAISALYDEYLVNGTLTVDVAGSDALTGAVAVTVHYLRVQ